MVSELFKHPLDILHSIVIRVELWILSALRKHLFNFIEFLGHYRALRQLNRHAVIVLEPLKGVVDVLEVSSHHWIVLPRQVVVSNLADLMVDFGLVVYILVENINVVHVQQ